MGHEDGGRNGGGVEMRDADGGWRRGAGVDAEVRWRRSRSTSVRSSFTLWNFRVIRNFLRRVKAYLSTASTENAVMKTEGPLGSQRMRVWALTGYKHCLLWSYSYFPMAN